MTTNKPIIFTDFDGIFSQSMLYTPEDKSHKIFGFGIRDAINFLADSGYQIHIVTGDSTFMGREISKKFCHNLKIAQFHIVHTEDKLHKILSIAENQKFIWIGDDFVDHLISKYSTAYYTTKNAPQILRNRATSTFPIQYFWSDLANELEPNDLLKYIYDRSKLDKTLALSCCKTYRTLTGMDPETIGQLNSIGLKALTGDQFPEHSIDVFVNCLPTYSKNKYIIIDQKFNFDQESYQINDFIHRVLTFQKGLYFADNQTRLDLNTKLGSNNYQFINL